MPEMTDRENYLFDLRGFLVVKEALTAHEVAALNDALDANIDRRVVAEPATADFEALAGERRYEFRDLLTWPQPWCQPFRDLIAHSALTPYLDEVLGMNWHLDRMPEALLYGKGTEGHALHPYGVGWTQPGRYYAEDSGEIRNGAIVVEFLLSDQIEGQGGFSCIPGSHKSRIVRPESISRFLEDADIVATPPAAAGDLIIFTESVSHGALPWQADHDRRVLLYRYTAATVHFGPSMYEVTFPAWVDELSPAQRAAMEPAHFYDRPNPDGSLAEPWDDWKREP
jgi:hypothetical protein